ncbi:spherulation-specific family 4 protein [Pseudonocardia hierapolitana]|uniref:Spherulation-specific family 4 protein n=1 Tax=Pseudonocardia hierapolitana TaxID=1128676 RepID=A0A561SYX5_9PSEU|nr:spherulation-specific family 4 protein [Pseudonocardia hierapolitana]TWF80031.1 spherulation-specific family 4 protein [Pseudonocardia hierapolitana]
MSNEPSGLLVPAYDYPSEGDEAWDTLTDVGGILTSGQMMVVVNHEDGHFTEANPDYEAVIGKLNGVCASVLGYVHDCYDNTKVEPPLCPRTTDIMGDVDRWFATYEVAGIFIDQLLPDRVDHAAALVQQVRDRHPGAVVVLNPGTIPPEEFMEQTDPAVVVIQEGSVHSEDPNNPPTFDANWPPPGWVRDRATPTPTGAASIAAGRLAIIGHTAPDPEHVDNLIAKAAQYNIRWVYAQHVTGSTYNPLSIHLQLLGERLSAFSRLGCLAVPFGRVFIYLLNYILCRAIRGTSRLVTAARQRKDGPRR